MLEAAAALVLWANFPDEEGQPGGGIPRTKAGTQGRCDVKQDRWPARASHTSADLVLDLCGL